MGMVFQQFNLFPHLTVLENITVAPLNLKLLTKEEATKKALELLKSIGLEDKKDNYPNELSGGQKQRVAIIRTLMITLIKTLVDKKNTIIIVSHEMEFIKNCATKVLFLDEGKIAYSGTPKKVFSTKDCPRLTEFLSKTSFK